MSLLTGSWGIANKFLMALLRYFLGSRILAATFSEINKAGGDTGTCERLGNGVVESNSLLILSLSD